MLRAGGSGPTPRVTVRAGSLCRVPGNEPWMLANGDQEALESTRLLLVRDPSGRSALPE